MRFCVVVCCVLFLLGSGPIASATAKSQQGDSAEVVSSGEDEKTDCTDLARDEEALMVFSTLGGGLTAIDPVTSEIRWTIADGNYAGTPQSSAFTRNI
ncbi:uncharacterized protein Dyak_GE11077 [Drosophila yakuba]|uniref:Uncharacterized protein n=1 Tax=Drosophila yakuba TaxID=7245 RepID=B4IV02_DROYA|nr:uncharacterized protein Dyak_GE11077 [Drosophila yakuba]